MNEEIKISQGVLNKIKQLRHIETMLGHLPSGIWTVDELQKKSQDPSYGQSLVEMEKRTEILFFEICEELALYRYNYEKIAEIINKVLSSSATLLKYCNAAEVKEALGVE